MVVFYPRDPIDHLYVKNAVKSLCQKQKNHTVRNVDNNFYLNIYSGNTGNVAGIFYLSIYFLSRIINGVKQMANNVTASRTTMPHHANQCHFSVNGKSIGIACVKK